MEKLMKQFMDQMNTQFIKIDNRFDKLEDRFDTLESRMDNLEKDVKEIKVDLQETKGIVQRIEAAQPQDIKAILYRVNTNLEERDHQIEALNKRVFKNESDIVRLSQQ